MFDVRVFKNEQEVSDAAFAVMKEVVKDPHAVLGLATGSTPIGLYQRMIQDHKENGTSYRDIVTFNLDEYVGLDVHHEQSYYTFMHEQLFNHIDILEENTHVPSGQGNVEQNCLDYEEMMKKYVVDIQVLGIGSDGHIAFNEPGTPFDQLTHVIALTKQTREDNARFFDGDIQQVPTHAITQGLGTIMRAKKIILLALGANKAQAVADMLEGEKSVDCPASVLQDHPDVVVLLDEAAASKLRAKSCSK